MSKFFIVRFVSPRDVVRDIDECGVLRHCTDLGDHILVVVVPDRPKGSLCIDGLVKQKSCSVCVAVVSKLNEVRFETIAVHVGQRKARP